MTGTVSDEGEVGQAMTQRDRFWRERGYDLFWKANVPEGMLGGDPLDFFESDAWSNGYDFGENNHIACNEKDPSESWCKGSRVSLDRAPDGTPSVKAYITKGNSDSLLLIHGQQFGPQGPEQDVVFSLEWYNPCDAKVRPNGKSGFYNGFGPHWGAADNVFHSPGGSTNYDDAWSLRIPLATSHEYFVYAYIPDKKVKHGRSWLVKRTPQCDTWELLELEVIQNDPITAKNATLRAYVNGELEREITGTQTRTKETVRPRGFGMYAKHNSGAPNDEVLYWRNWKIYSK